MAFPHEGDIVLPCSHRAGVLLDWTSTVVRSSEPPVGQHEAHVIPCTARKHKMSLWDLYQMDS